MPKGELYINGTDAFVAWGVSLDSSALSALMTPAPLKDMIENKSALENGKRVIRDKRKLDERTLTLGLNVTGKNGSSFLYNYSRFCSDVLAKGSMDITTKYQSGVIYHLDYVSCNQFGEYGLEMGKYSLRVVEPNPANRSDNYSEDEG